MVSWCLVYLFIYFRNETSLRWPRLDEDPFPLFGLPFCPINSALCLTDSFQFHDTPFINYLLITVLSVCIIRLHFRRLSIVLICLYGEGYFLLSLLLASVVLILRSLIHKDLLFFFFYRMIDAALFSFINKQTSVIPVPFFFKTLASLLKIRYP